MDDAGTLPFKGSFPVSSESQLPGGSQAWALPPPPWTSDSPGDLSLPTARCWPHSAMRYSGHLCLSQSEDHTDLRGFGLAQTVLLFEDLGVFLQIFSNLLQQTGPLGLMHVKPDSQMQPPCCPHRMTPQRPMGTASKALGVAGHCLSALSSCPNPLKSSPAK